MPYLVPDNGDKKNRKLVRDVLPIPGATNSGKPIRQLAGGFVIFDTPSGFPYYISKVNNRLTRLSIGATNGYVDLEATVFSFTQERVIPLEGEAYNAGVHNIGAINMNSASFGYDTITGFQGFNFVSMSIDTSDDTVSLQASPCAIGYYPTTGGNADTSFDFSNLYYGFIEGSGNLTVSEPFVRQVDALKELDRFTQTVEAMLLGPKQGAKDYRTGNNNLLVTKGFVNKGEINYNTQTIIKDGVTASDCHYLELQNLGPNTCEVNDILLLPGEKLTYPVASGAPLIKTVLNVRFETSIYSTGFANSYKL